MALPSVDLKIKKSEKINGSRIISYRKGILVNH